MSSTSPISKIAWLDSWLNILFSFARSSRIQILFEPILILFITSVFFSAFSSFTASACENVSVITSFLRRASVSISEEVCSSFHVARFNSVEGIEPSCAPAQCSFSVAFFKGHGTSGMLLLLLAMPILFQRYLRCWSWSFKPFEIYSFSIVQMSHDQYNLQVL